MQHITAEEIDALQEIINVGVGRAASLLNEMLNSQIILEVPFVSVFNAVDLQRKLTKIFKDGSFVAVRLNFSGSISGTADLVFPSEAASTLVSIATGETPDSPDLDAVKIGTLTEVGNIVINCIMGSISNILKQRLQYRIPIYLEDSIENILSLNHIGREKIFLLAQASFTIEELKIIGDIVLIFEMSSFEVLITAINRELEFTV